MAYAAMKGEKWVTVVDGREGPAFDEVIPESLTFSPDGKHFAYAASQEGKWFVVVDGKKGPEYDGIVKGSLVFSPDGERSAYGAWQRRETPRCPICVGPLRRVWLGMMYLFKQTSKDFVVLDGRKGAEYDEILPGSLAFSPDGRHFMYTATRLGKKFVVVDGRQAKITYDRLFTPAFVAGGVEYLAERDRDQNPAVHSRGVRRPPGSWAVKTPGFISVPQKVSVRARL